MLTWGKLSCFLKAEAFPWLWSSLDLGDSGRYIVVCSGFACLQHRLFYSGAATKIGMLRSYCFCRQTKQNRFGSLIAQLVAMLL